jgi:FMN-dependent NADH-azoreductase
MASLLFVQASPRGSYSYSLAISKAFVDSYQQTHPADKITTLDLFKFSLPEMDASRVSVRYSLTHGDPLSEAEKSAWQPVEAVINEFKSMDKYVFAVPMWNFGIPYPLKHYIDLLVQPGYTFKVVEKGYEGLVTGKPVFVAYARGGAYPPGTPAENFDFQKRYFELALHFIGFTDIRSLVMDNVLGGSREDAHHRRDALAAEARKMAETF